MCELVKYRSQVHSKENLFNLDDLIFIHFQVNPHLSFPSFYAGAGPVGGGLMTTGVSVEESSFLDEFMACDFSRDRSNLGSLADLSSVSGSLTELDNLPRPNTR